MAAVGTATLPDDVVLEILSRVADGAVAALFRCTVACKSWRALVADPCFLRRCWPDGIRHPSSFLGVFRQSTYACPPTFVSASPSPLGPSHGFPASFDSFTVRLLHNTEPLASHQGLLLVRLRQIRLQLAVCDMFAGTCDLLPVPNCASFSITGSAILTDADYCSNQGQSPLSSYSKKFKVLVIIREYVGSRESHRRLYSFSSAESSWKSFDLIEKSIFHSDLVVCRGTVHWLFEDSWNLYRFDFCNETSHGCLTKLSSLRDQFNVNPFNIPRLNVTIDGKLSLLRLRTECLNLEIWTHQGEKESGEGVADWLHTRVIELKPKTMPHIREVSGMCMGESTGTLLLVRDEHEPMYSVNLDTGAIDDVPSQFCSVTGYNAGPFEMDWAAFFMHRLERQCGSWE